MQGLRDLGNALVVALISVGLMIGALSISLVEFVPEAAPTVTDSLFASPIPLTATLVPTLGPESPTPSITPTFTITPTPPSSCLPPAGWIQITVQISETLDSLAARYHTTKEQLRAANCLFTDNLIAGSILYVPPTATSVPAVCIPGVLNWTRSYVVRPGDTLYRIGYNYFTTTREMMNVNCRTSELIRPGEILWVPNVAPRIPSPTSLPAVTVFPTDPTPATAIPFTSTFTVTSTPSDTPIPPTPTTAPTNTPEPTFTLTASPTPFPVVP